MRNSKPTQDTYDSARATIAKLVLASPLAGSVGDPENDNRLSGLEYAAAGNDPKSWLFLSVEFRRAGTSISLDVRAKSDCRLSSRQYEQDDNGNDYAAYTLHCDVNWPCHGSCDPATALARIELYREVAMLAATIHAQFSGARLWKFVQTKAQREQDDADAAAKRVHQAATMAIDDTRSGMRTGSAPRNVPIDALKDVPDGTYEHEFDDGKAFVMVVKRMDHTVMGLVTRTK
jgi:hypothetical protein